MNNEMFLLDTNIVIEFFSKKEDTVKHIGKLDKSSKLFVSVLTVSEIRMGWSEKDAAVFLPALYSLFKTIGISNEVAELAGKWRREYRERGITLSLVDTLIAATGYVNDMSVWTRNVNHYPMPELKLHRGDVTVN
jgi:predicted nucleic acid-binding protein